MRWIYALLHVAEKAAKIAMRYGGAQAGAGSRKDRSAPRSRRRCRSFAPCLTRRYMKGACSKSAWSTFCECGLRDNNARARSCGRPQRLHVAERAGLPAAPGRRSAQDPTRLQKWSELRDFLYLTGWVDADLHDDHPRLPDEETEESVAAYAPLLEEFYNGCIR